MLLISKDPQFTSDGEVVLGQCEPYTGGWKLRFFDRGEDEVLLTGTYFDLRRVQQACRGKDLDEMRTIAAELGGEIEVGNRATSRKRLEARFSEPEKATAVMTTDEVRQGFRFEEDLHKVVKQLSGGVGTDGSFSSLENHDGVLVVRIGSMMFLNDPDTVGGDLEKLFDLDPDGVVVDLDDVEVITSAGIRELVRFSDQCSQEGNLLSLANIKSGIQKVLEMASLETLLPSHGPVQKAIETLRGLDEKGRTEEAGTDAVAGEE